MRLGVGERIVVVGTSCVGKSAFAETLAKALSYPRMELDELYWGPNWTPKPDAEFRRLTTEAASAMRWVADGNYGRVRDVLWRRATTVIWLNYGFPTVLMRALRRTVSRILGKDMLWHGNRESVARSFLSRDSILVWVITTFHRRRREYASLRTGDDYPHLSWIEFRRPADAERYLSDLVDIRLLRPSDSLEELTTLLHAAYAPLGAMGLNYTAVDQSAAVTAERIEGGTCFVATVKGRIVGTIVAYPPHPRSRCRYLEKPGVAMAGQFGVAPGHQRSGIGSRLLDEAENWAREHGHAEIAIDTAEPAKHLIEYYARRGYARVDSVQWDGKRYRSVVMAKKL